MTVSAPGALPLTPLEPWLARKISAGRFTRAALEAYQLQQLQATLHRLRTRSPYYQRALAGTEALALTGLADLARFPFTTAEDLRREGPQFLCVSQSDVERVVTLDTSGTTGRPKRLYFTQADQELTIDFFGVGMSTLVAPGDRVLILLPGERPGSVGHLLALGLERIGVTPLKHGPVKDPAQTLAVIAAEEITSLVAAPTQALALARYSLPRPRPLKSVLLSTDHVPAAMVRALQAAWGCAVYNHYGMTEMGLGGGVACAAQRGYHLREADLYFEIVDPATGAPLPEGETGEVVFTTLTRQAMPLWRYRTGDLSRFVPGACPCGTTLKTLAWIQQRLTGQVELGGGPPLTMADLDEALFALEGVHNFTAVLEPAHLAIEVYLCAPPAAGIEAIVPEALAEIPALQAANLTTQVNLHTGYPPELGTLRKRQIEVRA